MTSPGLVAIELPPEERHLLVSGLRALPATEIVLASDVVGAGVDWSTATGVSDAEAIELLRAVQRKVARHGAAGPT